MCIFCSCSSGSQLENVVDEQYFNSPLRVKHFRNGKPIKEAKSLKEWKRVGDNDEPAWCYLNFDSRNEEKYGLYYNIFTLLNYFQGGGDNVLAPYGWELPNIFSNKNMAQGLRSSSEYADMVLKERFKGITLLKSGTLTSLYPRKGEVGEEQWVYSQDGFYEVGERAYFWYSPYTRNSTVPPYLEAVYHYQSKAHDSEELEYTYGSSHTPEVMRYLGLNVYVIRNYDEK